MGMSQNVNCPSGVPDWPRVSSWLAEHGLTVQMRMIDGQLAFPNEEPPANWKEIRVGSALGMVTIRRQPAGVELTIWGNADAGTQQTWNTIALAFAELGAERGII